MNQISVNQMNILKQLDFSQYVSINPGGDSCLMQK
jgi:hypothetical protein